MSNKKAPKLLKTYNYKLFNLNDSNRRITHHPVLWENMKRIGFLPSGAIHVVHGKNGKLDIIRGHHRAIYAEKLGLPIYYIIDDLCTELPKLEERRQAWSNDDFVYHYAQKNHAEYEFLLFFKEQYKLPILTAASLVGGESAGSNNRSKKLRDGTFVRGNMDHAYQVVRITEELRELGIEFATTSAFVAAISSVLRVPEFCAEDFLRRVKASPKRMINRSRKDDYLEEIESLYNYRARTPIALKFLANEKAKIRKDTFGRVA